MRTLPMHVFTFFFSSTRAYWSSRAEEHLKDRPASPSAQQAPGQGVSICLIARASGLAPGVRLPPARSRTELRPLPPDPETRRSSCCVDSL
jgi:hypothetical protein